MRIPKFFRKAAAFVMAAVTALSVMPATTAFAAGDIGTISFSMTYDSGGNAMRYNSSANIGGYTAGGTGKYKYRMSVDGETAFCIQPGVPLKTGNTLRRASSDAWNALSDSQRKAVGLALLYGYQGNRHNLTGSDDEKWLATQTLVWEFVTGCRESTGSYHQTSSTIYSLHFGSNYANDGARAAYDQIVSLMANHNTMPETMTMSLGKSSPTTCPNGQRKPLPESRRRRKRKNQGAGRNADGDTSFDTARTEIHLFPEYADSRTDGLHRASAWRF